jgi:hypothetical protein
MTPSEKQKAITLYLAPILLLSDWFCFQFGHFPLRFQRMHVGLSERKAEGIVASAIP